MTFSSVIVGTSIRGVGFPTARFNVPIYLDDVACDGTEEKLAQCNYDGATGDCRHFSSFIKDGDAGVICYEQGWDKCTLSVIGRFFHLKREHRRRLCDLLGI